MKLAKFLTYLFAILGIIGFLTILLDIGVVKDINFIQSMAEATDGRIDDIVGGFGCVFLFISSILAFIVFKNKKERTFLIIALSTLLFTVVNFYLAFGEVL
ncbi:MAG: hypothetical protein HUJ25_03365 [Crocinitomicaceae bacterium]|nr:hypothetical protein [Crocinitomicaceae bacterium]